MKKELIAELFEKFEAACYLYKEIECWSARDLQTILGYTKWSNFQKPKNPPKTPENPYQTILPMSVKWSKLAVALNVV
jgi:hypothetical protein